MKALPFQRWRAKLPYGSGRHFIHPPRAITRFPVLDALRFVLAFWVVMGHFGVFPLFAGADTNSRLGRGLVHGWNTITFGTAAVIGFFIISGFCIHLPFRNGETLVLSRYYARRYLRILVPLACGVGVFYLVGIHIDLLGDNSILWVSVLWSLVCEEIYYAAYPLLRLGRMRLGWTALLSASFAAAIAVLATHQYADDWRGYGPIRTALILLPVWLLGCLLAEKAADLAPLESSPVIWTWRLGIWSASWVCEILHFEFHVYYTFTMLPFGVLAFFWILQEIRHGMSGAQPWKPLVSAGAWSYSLYLIHGPAMFFFAERVRMPNLGYFVNWFAANAFILGASYTFYLLVERPSHRQARKISFQGPPLRSAFATLAMKQSGVRA
jgi:peptidoglycan/LPS O-acetylase OafA/YrhL